MPFRGSPVCIKCGADKSPLWTNAENLGVVCFKCLREVKEEGKSSQETKEEAATKRKTRSARTYKTRLNPATATKSSAPKGKGRRSIFKKTPYKSPAAVATPVTSDFVYYKGSYWQIGDIVSVVDAEDDVYYAQIRGFLTDQYCEKSAVLSWLLPSRESPPPNKAFDPATYILGPDEELPRKLECMEFIMHAPSDYYKAKNTPYPTVYPVNEPGFIWTRLEPIRRLIGMEDPEDKEKEKESDQSKEKETNIRQKNETVTSQKNETVTSKRNETITSQKNETVTCQKNETITSQKSETVTSQRNETITGQRLETVTSQTKEIITIKDTGENESNKKSDKIIEVEQSHDQEMAKKST